MEIITWTWPQILTQSVATQTRCRVYFWLQESKDGGAYTDIDWSNAVWAYDEAN